MFRRPPLNSIGQQVNWASSQARGLVAFWPLNEQSYSPAYELVRGVNGTPSGAAPYPGVTSPFGWARYPAREATARYFDCGDARFLDFGTGDFSISVWIRPVSNTANRNEMILAKWGTSAAASQLQLYINTAANAGDIALDFRDVAINPAGVVTGSVLSAYRHYNVVALRRTGVIEIWVNGAKVNVTPYGDTTAALNQVSTSVRIGNKQSGLLATNFEGPMSMLQVYNRALQPAEIQDHFINPKGIFVPSNPKPRVFTQVYPISAARLPKRLALNLIGNTLNYNSSQTRGLTGYWPLNEQTGNCVDYVSKQEGTAYNGTRSTALPFGLCRFFTAGLSQYLNCGNSRAFDFGAGDFTLSYWIRPVTISAFYSVLTKDASAVANRQISLRVSNNTLGDVCLVIFQSPSVYCSIRSTSAVLVANKLAHVAFVRTNGTFSIYVNGISVAVSTAAGGGGTPDLTLASTPADFLIGRDVTNSVYASCFLGHLKVYNRALTTSEIQDHYLNPNGIWKPYQKSISTPLRYPVNLGGVRIAKRTPLNTTGNVLAEGMPTQDIVAFWPLNECSGSPAINYRRSSSALATLGQSGGVGSVVTRYGYARNFVAASSTYLSGGAAAVLDTVGTGDFAFAFIMTPANTTLGMIITRQGDTDNQFSIRHTTGIISAYIFGGGVANPYFYRNTSSTPVVAGVTISVVVQRQAGTIHIYVDGIEQPTTTGSGNGGTEDMAIRTGVAADLQMGARQLTGTRSFYSGAISHMTVYTRALEPQEIWNFYRNPNSIWLTKNRVSFNSEANPWLYNRIQRGQ